MNENLHESLEGHNDSDREDVSSPSFLSTFAPEVSGEKEECEEEDNGWTGVDPYPSSTLRDVDGVVVPVRVIGLKHGVETHRFVAVDDE